MEPALKPWFLHIGDRNEGPFSEADIRSRLAGGQVTPESYVWREGMGDWKKISELDVFRPALAPARAPQPIGPIEPLQMRSSASSPNSSNSAREDLSALIEVPHRREEPTVYLDAKALKKVKKEMNLKARGPEKSSSGMFWKVLVGLMLLVSVFFLMSKSSRADDGTTSNDGPERMNVQALKHKYWAQGDQDELRVVQNRRYSKANSLELGLMGGFVSSDPFLSIHALGASLGYYLSENLEIGLLGWKYYSGNSSALDTLQQTQGTTANTNPPKYFLGADVKWSPLYGKLSLLGEKIIYYDIYLLGGAGETSTESGTDPTPLVGVGSQIYLSRRMMLQLTYYQMVYNENVLSSTTGAVADTRLSWTSAVMLGVNFLVF